MQQMRKVTGKRNVEIVCVPAGISEQWKLAVTSEKKKYRSPDLSFVELLLFIANRYGGQTQAGTVQFLLTAILPGGVLLLIGKITRQEVGYGDGILLLVCGLCLGGKETIFLFVSGLFLMFPISLVLLLSGHTDRRAELPFAPFLLASYLFWLMQI